MYAAFSVLCVLPVVWNFSHTRLVSFLIVKVISFSMFGLSLVGATQYFCTVFSTVVVYVLIINIRPTSLQAM